jgi:hypothetical protein
MKTFLLLFFTLSALGDVSLDDAYKRERAFLSAQKEALRKMKGSLTTQHTQRKARAQGEITQKERELSILMLKNQELHEEYKAIEKGTKESSQMSGQLEKNALKISENLRGVKSKLGLSHEDSTELDPVKKFEGILSDSKGLIDYLSQERWAPGAFLNEEDHLVQGEVLFYGLFASWGKINGKIYSLVPYNNEFLKVASVFEGKEVYIFAPNFERTGFRAAKSWKESVADALPGVVMIAIMLCVLGLFILLARS